jgi:hypothetical protein
LAGRFSSTRCQWLKAFWGRDLLGFFRGSTKCLKF